MARDVNFLRAAFLNVYNLGLLGFAGFIALYQQDWMLGAAALGLEALWLGVGSSLPAFQRAAVASQEAARRDEAVERVKELCKRLPKEWSDRVVALGRMLWEVDRDIRQNPSFEAAALAAELGRIESLLEKFAALAESSYRAEEYIARFDDADLQRREREARRLVESSPNSELRTLATKNASILESRRRAFADIRTFHATTLQQMSLLENTVRLLHDRALTMTSSTELTSQLDELVGTSDAMATSAREVQGLMDVAQVAPVDATASDERAPTTNKRIRL